MNILYRQVPPTKFSSLTKFSICVINGSNAINRLENLFSTRSFPIACKTTKYFLPDFETRKATPKNVENHNDFLDDNHDYHFSPKQFYADYERTTGSRSSRTELLDNTL